MQTLIGLSFACGMASAQDFAMRVADPNPLGIGNFVPSSLDLIEASDAGVGIKGTFIYGLGVQTAYDSNFLLKEDDEEDEITISLQPSFSYTSDPEGGAPFTFSANYRPAYIVYLNNTDLNEFDQATDVTMTWVGGLTEVSVFASYQPFSGTDRLTGEFTNGTSIAGGVRGTRQIAPRTSLNGSLTYSQSDYSSGDQEGTQIFSGSLGVLWMATGRTSIGSSIGFSQTESDTTGTRDALSLLAELRYRLGERIWLSASIGPELSSDSERGGDDLNLSANISASYVINERWSWVNSVYTGTIASPSDAGYLVNNLSFRTGLQHQMLRGSISSGFSFDYSDYESVADVLVERGDENNLSLYLAYSRQLWSERLALDTSVRYRVNNGEEDWSQWLLSSGLNMQF